nr:HAMP domain-containing sensor histidine kinase [Paenibacillus bovis]
MIFAVLIFIIGLIPIFLGYSLFHLYEKSKLTNLIFLFMLCITFWQIDVSILYIGSPYLNEQTTLILFKLFRIGPIAALPLILFITYELYKTSVSKPKNFLGKIENAMLNKGMVIVAFISTGIVYAINWTSFGIEGLTKYENKTLGMVYYYPIYGDLQFSFFLHLIVLLLFLILLVFVSKSINNNKMKSFIKTLVISSIILFCLGLTNFIPSYQILISSIAVLIYSIFILIAFIKMYNALNADYLNVVQRQNKLDYIGNMTASLIHEVKNSLSIIKGYSEIIPSLQKLEPHTDEMMRHVITSSQQLSNLVNAYNQFLKNDLVMAFKSQDVVHCIHVAKQVCDKLLKENRIKVKITSDSKVIPAYINETYFTQVLVNLIKNSIEAIPEDRENREIVFHVKDVNHKKVIIDMFDCGCGIPPEDWDKVFLPYNSTKVEGTGLGLPFCNKVLFSHRGFIDIMKSTPEGTHFRIQLPKSKFIEIEKAI